MKKVMMFLCVLSLFGVPCTAEAQEESNESGTIYLPKPDTKTGMPLMQALQNRQTHREFSVRKISDQNMSEILWAANGVNRENGKRTIPTARDSRDLKVYVIRQGGAFFYDPENNTLTSVNPSALIYAAAMQDYVKQAEALLVFVSNNKNHEYGAMHAGSAYQNVGLYAASVGLNNVVLGSIDKDLLHKELNLKDDEYVVIAQALGWPKTK